MIRDPSQEKKNPLIDELESQRRASLGHVHYWQHYEVLLRRKESLSIANVGDLLLLHPSQFEKRVLVFHYKLVLLHNIIRNTKVGSKTLPLARISNFVVEVILIYYYHFVLNFRGHLDSVSCKIPLLFQTDQGVVKLFWGSKKTGMIRNKIEWWFWGIGNLAHLNVNSNTRPTLRNRYMKIYWVFLQCHTNIIALRSIHFQMLNYNNVQTYLLRIVVGRGFHLLSLNFVSPLKSAL